MIFDVITFLPCFRAVTVENCHYSTIVLGVTKTAVNIIGCDSCTFFAVCDRMSFRFVFTFTKCLSYFSVKNQFSGRLSQIKWNPKIQGLWHSDDSTRRPSIWPGLSLLWFSPLLQVVFLRVLQFSPRLKHHFFKFQFDLARGLIYTSSFQAWL